MFFDASSSGFQPTSSEGQGSSSVVQEDMDWPDPSRSDTSSEVASTSSTQQLSTENQIAGSDVHNDSDWPHSPETKEPPSPHSLAQLRQITLDIFNRYVYDELPIRLIRISDMKLVDRGDVQRHFQDRVFEKVTESEIQNAIRWNNAPRFYPDDPRRNAIRSLILEVVTYAILSHRWLQRGEVGYREMLSQDIDSDSMGYRKLKQFCDAAAANGMEFVWMDTCCIDKSSSAELNESICSMFQWYKNAHLCIVHLSQTTSISDMPCDPWFKRGWTLQELLAPQNMKFYAQDWTPLTESRRDIERRSVYVSSVDSSPFLTALSQSSGVPESTLFTFSPSAEYVAEYMPWARRRRTTRGEDRAYSLMGIFGVRFPIAYGEGPQQAFRRLIEAILQASTKPGVLNWAGTPAVSRITRALPSSPDCYDYPSSQYSGCSFFSKQEIRLTSMGLRVALVILPVDVLAPPNLCLRTYQGEVVLHCEEYGIGRLTAMVRPSPEAEDDLHTTITAQKHALGIYNYYHMSYRVPNTNQQVEQFQLEKLSLAYLLVSCPRGGWKKVSTDKIISFMIPDCNEYGVRDADFGLLKTVYL